MIKVGVNSNVVLISTGIYSRGIDFSSTLPISIVSSAWVVLIWAFFSSSLRSERDLAKSPDWDAFLAALFLGAHADLTVFRSLRYRFLFDLADLVHFLSVGRLVFGIFLLLASLGERFRKVA